MLKSVGVETNVDINKIIEASSFIMSKLGHKTRSRTGEALSAKKKVKTWQLPIFGILILTSLQIKI